jgi:hypothetical protein
MFRFNNFSGTYSGEDLFLAKGGSEKEIFVPGTPSFTSIRIHYSIF